MSLPEGNYGACFIGPPGSGKTSCVLSLQEICKKLKRNTFIINLDPANDFLPYEPDFDIRSIINVKDIMKDQQLGPNGALLYCMETISKNVFEITNAIKPLLTSITYFLIDFPGQVEIYTHSDSMQIFIKEFQKNLNTKLATVNLIDSILASNKQSFLGSSLMALGMMLRLFTPHINLISKFDLVQSGNVEIIFSHNNLDYEDFINNEIPNPLHNAIIDLLKSFDLVSYTFFSVYDETSLIELLRLIDKSIGCTWML